MDGIRVRGLAKECSVSSDEVIAKAKALGVRVDGPASVLREDIADTIRDAFGVVDEALVMRRSDNAESYFEIRSPGFRAPEPKPKPKRKPPAKKPAPEDAAQSGIGHLHRTRPPSQAEPFTPPDDAEPLSFRFYFGLRYNRPINLETDGFINNFGALVFKTEGRVYAVTFETLDFGKDADTPPDVVEYGLRNPIVPEPGDEGCSDLYELTFDAFAHIEDIELVIEEIPYESLLPVEVVSGGFVNPYDPRHERYPLPEKLLKRLNKRLTSDLG